VASNYYAAPSLAFYKGFYLQGDKSLQVHLIRQAHGPPRDSNSTVVVYFPKLILTTLRWKFNSRSWSLILKLFKSQN